MSVRPAAVAGSFYPDNASELRRAVQEHVAAARVENVTPKALIAPHAGYKYSGPVAGTAYKAIEPLRGTITGVVLIGPSHRIGFDGLAVSSASSFATPLGNVPIDKAGIDRARVFPQLIVLDRAHAQEHSLEVHLPFLQEVLGQFSLVPIVTGAATASEVGQVIEELWGGSETLIVISSDLSHYHDYHTAARMDAATSRAIEELRGEDIAEDHACGCVAIRGLLWAARRRGLQGRTLDLRSSGDTAGTPDRVVGYGAYAFTEG